MKCPHCGQLLRVHILESKPPLDQNYCPDCHVFFNVPDKTGCQHCGTDLEMFRASGSLGCEHCYFFLSSVLMPLINHYKTKPVLSKAWSKDYQASQLAKARSAELYEYVFSQDRSIAQAMPTTGDRESFNPSSGFISELSTRADELSLRIRQARNIKKLNYRAKLLDTKKQRLAHYLLSAGSTIVEKFQSHLNEDGKPGFDQSGHLCALYFQESGIRIYCNDEDHLRIEWQKKISINDCESDQLMRSISGTMASFDQLDDLFEYQYKPEFGFLTACPAISGAGMRLSLQIFLNKITSYHKEWFKNLNKSGYEIRIVHSNNSHLNTGHLVQFSHKSLPVGYDWQAALSELQTIVGRIVQSPKSRQKTDELG